MADNPRKADITPAQKPFLLDTNKQKGRHNKESGLSMGYTDAPTNSSDFIGDMITDPMSVSGLLRKALQKAAIPLFGGLKAWNTVGGEGIPKLISEAAKRVTKGEYHVPFGYADKGYGIISKNSNMGRMQVARFRDVPWMDWDIPDELHANAQVEGIKEVIEQLSRYTKNNKSLADVYVTPGGYHAVDVGPIKEEAKDFYNKSLLSRFFGKKSTGIGYNVDPGYENIAASRNSYHIRTGPKMTRNPNEEFIGSYIGSIGDETKRDLAKTKMVEVLYEMPIEANVSETIRSGRACSERLQNVLATKALGPLLNEAIPKDIQLKFLSNILYGRR